MDVTFDGTVVNADSEARERFYDSRGYGTPRSGKLELAPVEAAHLLFRGDLKSVRDSRSGSELDFHDLLSSTAVSEVGFFVYKELRDRGFYLSPARRDKAGDATSTSEFLVYPRGKGPWDDTVAYRVRAVSERERVSARDLRELAQQGSGTDTSTAVLAVVDEESEVTYLELGSPAIEGTSEHDIPALSGRLLSDRVLVTDPPDALYHEAFYGQPLDRDEQPIQLSLVEAAYLTGCGLLTVDTDRETEGVSSTQSGHDALIERGREVEGERFDRRLTTYRILRESGVVPKTGYKFGADFRTYADVTDVDNLGHSELLVRVVPADHVFSPRDLALDVRLAHGVRKRMVFALADESVEWLSVERLTP